MKIFILLIAFTVFSQNSFSQVDQSALTEAQKVLRSSSQRQDIISKDKKAQDADQFASEVVGGDPALKNEMYGVSADVLNHVMQASDGDPAKAQELLLKAMKDPKQFLQSLPAAEQEKIRQIANSAERKKNAKP